MKKEKKSLKRVSRKIRKGDRVMAITGNYKGLTGNVLSVDGEKILVQGLNMVKKHVKRSEQAPQGGIIEMEKPIHISNLMVCVEDDKPKKLKVRDDNGERQLVYKDGDSLVTYRSLKKEKN